MDNGDNGGVVVRVINELIEDIEEGGKDIDDQDGVSKLL